MGERSTITRNPTWPLVLALSVFGGLRTPARAHEPVFSLGPETIWEGGVGIETEFEFEQGEGKRLSALHYELIYGLKENWSLQLVVPQILELEAIDETEHGLGDIDIRTKYRFFRRDLLGAQHKVSGILGIKLPAGDENANPPLGAGTTSFLFGVSYGYESRTWYHFLTTRYRWRAERGGRNPGDRLLIDSAIGYRPWRREYTEWDLVVLLEMNTEVEFKSKFEGSTLPNTGGDTLWLGPTSLLSPNPQWMFKGGIQFPVYEDHNGNQEHREIRVVFGIEHHF